MYIRRKVFSKLQTEDGQERYFSTTEFTRDFETKQREFSKKKEEKKEKKAYKFAKKATKKSCC